LFELLTGLQPPHALTIEPVERITTAKDEAFLKEVIKIVEERMQDPNFNIDEVAAGMSMAVQLFTKIKKPFIIKPG
jgi:poly-beta-hydroxyalkanoate depolymerase